MNIIEIIKVIILGIVEGITEWLPISSTGHMILVDEFLHLNITPAFKEMFLVVIQLGAILSVVVLYFKKLNPFKKDKEERKNTINLWLMVIVGCIPAGIIGTLFNDWFDKVFYNGIAVSIALIVYGVLFIIIENKNKNKVAKIKTTKEINTKTALKIGTFQLLSLIPGTSRSGTTILGGLISGMDRSVAAEYTFFLAIPIMFGASLIKLLKFGFNFTNNELIILIVGTFTAFAVSLLVIKLLMKYIKKHDFKVFGWYRIILGIVVLLYFILK